jgi:uncharacterized protein (DUF302 family)
MSTATLNSFTCHLALPFDQAVAQTTAALKAEGFGVLTTINVQATMQEKLGVDVPEYMILGACNPALAHRALSATPDVGLLLPCNVTVYAENGQSVVSIIDPGSMLAVIDNPELVAVADEARAKLARVHAALTTT